jgi:sterol 3beta-glucosyltransferase
MRIAIMAFGSRGDVQPFVALGQGLKAAGYAPYIVALDDYEAFVTGAGVDFFPLGISLLEANPDQFMAAIQSGQNTVSGVLALIGSMAPVVTRMVEAVSEACANADALIASLIAMPAAHAFAEKHHVPYFVGMLQPFGRTTAFTCPAFPLNLPDSGPLNMMTHLFVEQLFSLSMLAFVNGWRRDYLDLPALRPLSYPYFALHGRPVPWLYGISPAVQPKPADWSAAQHMTGYWFLNGQADYRRAG